MNTIHRFHPKIVATAPDRASGLDDDATWLPLHERNGILVVDDHEGIQGGIASRFRFSALKDQSDLKVDMINADDADGAKEWFMQKGRDLLLIMLDFSMPGNCQHGDHFLRWIQEEVIVRRRVPWESLPIILANSSEPNDNRALINLGADFETLEKQGKGADIAEFVYDPTQRREFCENIQFLRRCRQKSLGAIPTSLFMANPVYFASDRTFLEKAVPEQHALLAAIKQHDEQSHGEILPSVVSQGPPGSGAQGRLGGGGILGAAWGMLRRTGEVFAGLAGSSEGTFSPPRHDPRVVLPGGLPHDADFPADVGWKEKEALADLERQMLEALFGKGIQARGLPDFPSSETFLAQLEQVKPAVLALRRMLYGDADTTDRAYSYYLGFW